MTTDSLFVKPSFVNGLASIGNLAGTLLCNASETSDDADRQALASDWQIVGMDISEALDTYGR